MEAPDKIYAKIIAGSLCVSRKPDKIFGEPYPEYIRKDALLEWAKNLKEKWEEPPMSRHSPGCVYMLEQVIEKLNSM